MADIDLTTTASVPSGTSITVTVYEDVGGSAENVASQAIDDGTNTYTLSGFDGNGGSYWIEAAFDHIEVTKTAELDKVVLGGAGGGVTLAEFEELADEKLALAINIDVGSFGLAQDEARVDPALGGIRDAIDEGTLALDTGISAAKRMIYGEEVTEMIMAAGGPSTSEHLNGHSNISRRVAEYASYPLLDLMIAILPLPYLFRRLPFSGPTVTRAMDSVENFSRDVLRRYLPRNIADHFARRIRETADILFDRLIDESANTGSQLSKDRYEELRDKQTDLLTEDQAAVIFKDGFFGDDIRAWKKDLELPVEPVDESLDRLIGTLDADDGGPDISGNDADAATAARRRREQVNGLADEVEEALDWGIADDLIRGATPILDAVEVIAFLAGAVTKNPYVLAYSTLIGFVTATINMIRNVVKWWVAFGYIITLRDVHRQAITEVLNASPADL